MSPLEIQMDTMINDPLRPNLSSRLTQQDLVNKGLMAIGMAPMGITKAKTAYELAHEVAQKNATKMLGLPENNTAMQRAKALGFNTTGYHGTDVPTNFKRFKPTPNDETGIKGVSFALEPSQANFFAEGRGMHNGEFDGRIIKAKIRGKPPVDYITAMERIQNQRVPPATLMGEERVLRKHLKDADSVGIDYSNSIGGTEISVVDPSRIRSIFAAFDPARVNESDLLAGLAPYLGVGGLLGLGMYGNQDRMTD
jgi:hypothetical protein